MPVRRAALVTIAFFTVLIASGQNKEVWDNIENAIRDKKDLPAMSQRLEAMAGDARQEANYIRYAHALNDLIRIRDIRTEDSLYFRNSGCIDSLLNDKRTPPELATLLHFMQARRLAAFTGRYLKFNRERYETPDLPCNYAALPTASLDSLVLRHFQSVKKDLPPLLQTAAMEEVYWLSSNPGELLFKPAFQDILMAEEIGFMENKRLSPAITIKKAGEWMTYTPDQFIIVLDSLRAFPGNALAGYGEWIVVNRSTSSVRYFIETLARKFLYQRFFGDTSIAHDYERYLTARAKDSATAVKAYAIYQLCLMWNSKADVREQRIDWYPIEAWNIGRDDDPDTAYTPARALQLYEDNKGLFKDYAYLEAILEDMQINILSEKLKVKMDEEAVPGAPVLLRLLYKNNSRIWYRIVRQDQDDTLSAKHAEALAYLLDQPAVREVEAALPLPADHASHRTFLKVDPLLPAGIT